MAPVPTESLTEDPDQPTQRMMPFTATEIQMVIDEAGRQYGEPKLKKPVELSGISATFSEVYIRDHCTFPVCSEG
jgi:hypothetical protein